MKLFGVNISYKGCDEDYEERHFVPSEDICKMCKYHNECPYVFRAFQDLMFGEKVTI